MLTQFGKVWIDTSQIFSVFEESEKSGDKVYEKISVQSINRAYETFYLDYDPEGFKAFKAWLKYQSAKEVFKRQDARDEFVRTKMLEMGL
jgi:hypothetical protein